MEEKNSPPGIASGKRVAHCLTCGHEWQPRDGTKTKPSRCPECMKRTVKWRDLCTPEELTLRKREELGVEKPEEITETEEENLDPVDAEPKEGGAEIVEKETEPEKKPVQPKKKDSLKPDEENSLEKIQETHSGGIVGLPFVLALGGIFAAGLCLFLFLGRKKRSVKPLPQTSQEDARRARELELTRARAARGFSLNEGAL